MKNGLWRKFGHNYTAPSAYLITVVTTNRQPLLGTLETHPVHGAHVNPSPLGLAVIATFYDIEKQVLAKTGTHVQVVQYQLMPDHFHGILFVREPLPSNWHLGRIIGSWKGACSRAFWRISGLSRSEVALTHNQQNVIYDREKNTLTSRSVSSAPPLFEAGYNDRILHGKNQLSHWVTYLHDNPRRLWLKRANPDLFRIRQDIRFGQTTCTALGNIFLADYPQRAVVQCSRRLTQAEIDTRKAACLADAANGTVFVSAAVSEGEKQITRALREDGFPLIILLNDGFPQPDSPHYRYFKPSGVYFETCAAGRLLLVEPSQAFFDRPDIAAKVIAKAGDIPHDTQRYRFLALNAMAEEIAR